MPVMPTLRELARSVRHAPGLEHMDFIWNAIRRPYYALAERRGGVTLTLGGEPVKVPLEFADQGWESYEMPAMGAFVEWVKTHPTGIVIDVGCAVGLYTHTALQVSSTVTVIAIDADLASLRATQRLTGDAGPRLTLLRGFIGQTPSTAQTFAGARQATQGLLASDEGTGNPTYTMLGSTDAIPTYSLDGLFAETTGQTTPVLIKMDIEGAEMLALSGAATLLARPAVTALVSVHPIHLARDFGQAPADVRAALSSHGYAIDLLGIDHEEHWWCHR